MALVSLKDIARQAARDAERVAIKEVLDRVHWNRAKAARLLQISYKALLYKIVQCGLVTPEERAEKAEGPARSWPPRRRRRKSSSHTPVPAKGAPAMKAVLARHGACAAHAAGKSRSSFAARCWPSASVAVRRVVP